MASWGAKLWRGILVPPLYTAVILVGWTVLSLPLSVDRRTVLWPAVAGFSVAALFLLSGIRLLRLYVLGHELTHWLAAKLCRRRTGQLRAGSHSGSIEVENPNALIVLAPYFVPVYTLALVGLYGLIGIWIEPLPDWGVALFCGGLGATYAFHLALTGLALQRGQQDLHLCGPVFSVGVILLGNAVLILGAMVVTGRLWDLAFAILTQRTFQLWQLAVTLIQGGLAWAGSIRSRH